MHVFTFNFIFNLSSALINYDFQDSGNILLPSINVKIRGAACKALIQYNNNEDCGEFFDYRFVIISLKYTFEPGELLQIEHIDEKKLKFVYGIRMKLSWQF